MIDFLRQILSVMLKKIMETIYPGKNQKQITTSFVMNRFHNHMIFYINVTLNTSINLPIYQQLFKGKVPMSRTLKGLRFYSGFNLIN